jgi:hypothetical protein
MQNLYRELGSFIYGKIVLKWCSDKIPHTLEPNLDADLWRIIVLNTEFSTIARLYSNRQMGFDFTHSYIDAISFIKLSLPLLIRGGLYPK